MSFFFLNEGLLSCLACSSAMILFKLILSCKVPLLNLDLDRQNLARHLGVFRARFAGGIHCCLHTP